MARFVAFVLFLLCACTTLADDGAKLVGVWRLTAFDIEFQQSGERQGAFGGRKSSGYLIFTPERRMMGLITAEGRKPGTTQEERAALFSSMLSYTGMYRIEGEKFITKVDHSWNEGWNGTDQVRFYKLAGDKLDIVSAWAPAVNLPERPMIRGIVSWERVK
jgi:Lipocalin-like domain